MGLRRCLNAATRGMIGVPLVIQVALLSGCQNPTRLSAVTQLESTDLKSACTVEGINVTIQVSKQSDQFIIFFGARSVADHAELRRLLQMGREDWLKIGVPDPVVRLSVAKNVPWSDVFAVIATIQDEGISRIEFCVADTPPQ